MEMKKILLILVGLSLLLSLAGGVSAVANGPEITQDDYNAGNNNGTTKVTIAVGEFYSVTLPADFTLTLTDGKYNGRSEFEVEIIRLNPEHNLTLAVNSTNKVQVDEQWHWNLLEVDGESLVPVNNPHKLPYRLGWGLQGDHIGNTKNTEILATGGDVVFIDTRVSIKSYYIHALVDKDIGDIQANSYQDTLKFTVNITDVTP